MDRHHLEDELIAYLRDRCECDLGRDADLLAGGYVDSLLVMELVAYIRSQFSVSLSAVDLAPRNFRSVGRLAELIASRLPSLPNPSLA